MVESVVKADQVTKMYGGFAALKAVDLAVGQGDILGLVGDNGAGKSTLLKMLVGLAFPSKGEVSLFGEPVSRGIEKLLRRTGAIIEQPGFFPQLSVEKNIEYYRIQKGVPGKDAVQRALETVNLGYARTKKARDLSMGMKQRLGLAIALLGEPELLILDEPINGLDPSGIMEMRSLMLKLNRERNVTILISSHNLPELEQLATVYAFLDKGVLLEQVGADALEKRCSDYIDIAVSEPEKYVVGLERQLGHTAYLVLEDKTIRINNPHQGIEAYSNIARETDLQIFKLERHKTSLEQYYLSLKERGAA